MSHARTAPLRSFSSQAVCSCALALAAGLSACTPMPRAEPRRASDAPPPLPARVVPGEEWRATPALGYPADATRRNLRPGESLTFRELSVTVVSARSDAPAAAGANVAELRLRSGNAEDVRTVASGGAVNWNGYRVAVVAIPGPGELGGGFVGLELATLSSLPPHIANAAHAGGADMRLRVPHRITHVTLHHTGSAQPLRPTDNPVQILRNLQAWGASDRNWWDVPYHYLIDLDGRVYEGRDWRYMGETNTGYNPGGHFLISVIGNYELQQPTPSQIDAITEMMAWAVRAFDVPLDRIGGHYHYASTSCPGQHLRGMLEDGSLQRRVAAQLR
jgi:hypothetical protein